MSPGLLAAGWAVVGVVAAFSIAVVRRRRLAWLAPAVIAAVAPLTSSGPGWPGPAASVSGGLVLGRPALGLIVASAAAIALSLLLAPGLDGGEVLTGCLVGAASTVLLAATVPLIWGVGVAVAVGCLAVRWLSVAPGRATLAAARVGGIGAGCIVGAAAFVAPVGTAQYSPRGVLTGAMLAVGVSCIIALVPLGGWATGVTGAVRGADLAPWALLLGPGLILSTMALAPRLVAGGQAPFDNTLLVLGLVSVVFGGTVALFTRSERRYGRVLLGDLGLAAAGVGSTHAEGRGGALLLILTHLCVGALLLHPARTGLRSPRRLAWLALSGVPPTPAFWGRYLILVACTATAPTAMAAGLVGVTVLFFLVIGRLVHPEDDGVEDPTPISTAQRLAAWAAAVAAIAVGLAPAAASRGVFGV